MPGVSSPSEGAGSRTLIGLPRDLAAPKPGLHKTTELLFQVLGAGDEDPDLSALSAALKAKLELSDLRKPPPYPVLWCGTFDQGCGRLQRHPQLSCGHLFQHFPPRCEDCACL